LSLLKESKMKKENTEQRADTGTYFSRMLLNEMVDEATVDLSATPYFFL
jgi:ribosomal protein L18